jgi:hypothetical protein
MRLCDQRAGRRAARKGSPPRITRPEHARGALEGLEVQEREMSGGGDRRSGSRADRSGSPSPPRLRWPSEQGRKPQPETNVEREAPPNPAAFKRDRSDVETVVDSRALSGLLERASREKPLPASSQRAASGLRPMERLLQDRLVLEGLRQLGLAVAIVLILGFVSLRIFSPRDASVGPADDGTSRAPSPVPGPTAPKEAAILLRSGPKLNVEFDRAAPAGQPLPLRVTVGDAPEGSTIVVSGLGPGATLSAGENRDVEWRLGLADLSDVSVMPAKDFVGTMILGVEMRLPDGGVAARRTIKLEWTGEALAQRANEAAQANATSASSGTPAAARATHEAAPAAEGVKEKQVARAMPPQVETPAQAEPAPKSAAARAEPGEGEAARVTPCFAKLDGKVVLQGNCRTVWTQRKSVTFESGEKRLSITLDHDRVWRLKWNGEDKGKIYKREECWGSDKAFVCEHPPRPKPKS